MTFRKGDDPNINRTGLNKGSHWRPWYNLQRLADMADEILPRLKPAERINYIARMQEILISRIPVIPKTPQESVDLVKADQDAKQKLEFMEANVISSRPVDGESDRTGVGSGTTEVQA